MRSTQAHLLADRETTVAATLGPRFCTDSVIRDALTVGVRSFRQPWGYRTQPHLAQAEIIRRVGSDMVPEPELLVDLPSSRPRLGKPVGGSWTLEVGSTITIGAAQEVASARLSNSRTLFVPGFEAVLPHLSTDDRVLLRDGAVELVVQESQGAKNVFARVRKAEEALLEGNSLAFPDSIVPFDLLTDTDRSLFAQYRESGILPDWVAFSFAEDQQAVAAGIDEITNLLGGTRPKFMAKIETAKGIAQLSELLEVCDGAMVARGDLALSVPCEQLASAQSLIVETCRAKGRTVVVATGFLERYSDTGLPPRGEALDIANAVHQGAHAILLCRETAGGEDPVDVIQTCKRIVDYEAGRGPTPAKLPPAWRSTIAACSAGKAHPVIAIEGIDGAGKSSVAKGLAEKLDGTYLATPPQAYHAFRTFFEEEERPVESRLLFYLGSLWESWRMLDRRREDAAVILDRYTLSTRLYHEAMLERDLFRLFRQWAPPPADLTISLDVSVEQAQSRLAERSGGTTFDCQIEQNEELQRHLAERFRKDADVTVDTTNRTVGEVLDDCVKLIRDILL